MGENIKRMTPVVLEEMIDLNRRKNSDYAGGSEFENFERAALLASWFEDPVDKVFATMIGIKLARLGTLKKKGVKPNCEPVADTHKDLATYSALWTAHDRSPKETVVFPFGVVITEPEDPAPEKFYEVGDGRKPAPVIDPHSIASIESTPRPATGTTDYWITAASGAEYHLVILDTETLAAELLAGNEEQLHRRARKFFEAGGDDRA